MLKKIIKFFLIVFVLMLISIVIIASLIYITNTKLLSIELKGAWIGFVGAIVGGIITFLGVLITIYYGEKTRQKTYDDNLALTNEQIRLEKMPYLEIKVTMVDDPSKLDSYIILDVGESSKDNIYAQIDVNNVWENVVKNISLQIIIENEFDKGKYSIASFLNPNHYCTKFIDFKYNSSYLIEKENHSISIKMIFFYEDILSNCYKQEYSGEISRSCCQINEEIDYCFLFSCSAVEEPKLTKINYYFVSDKEKQKIKKEKENLNRINQSIKRFETYSRKNDVQDYQQYFLRTYFNDKMRFLYNFFEYKNKEKYGGGVVLNDFKIISDNIVQTIIEGGISSDSNMLSFKYKLAIDLTKKTIKFNNFSIIGFEGFSLIDRIIVLVIFHRTNINYKDHYAEKMN